MRTRAQATRKYLSVCIPTYNRHDFLKYCLDSIVVQFSDKKIYERVEIIISDNASQDTTQEVVQEYQKRYINIRYFRNKETIGPDLNIIKSATYARGAYIWFFSDDDLHYSHSLRTVLNVIQKYKPDSLIGNLDLCSKDATEICDRNLLRVDTDKLLKTKKELFLHLETTFFLPIDWYVTCLSNTIVSRRLFDKNVDMVMKKYPYPANKFLHSSLIYYDPSDFPVYILSTPVATFRADNRSFGPKKHKEFLIYLYALLNTHYSTLYKINKKSISFKFTFLLMIKTILRQARLVFLTLFKYDISDILVKLFYKKSKP